MMIRQYRLYEIQTDQEAAELVCWLPDDSRLTPGTVLTLKETGERQWKILARYRPIVEATSLNRRWQVGGLS